MKTWKRSPYARACGGKCGSIISEGDLLLEIQQDNGTSRIRCAACAKAMFGEDPPTDLPALEPVARAVPPHDHGVVSVHEMAERLRVKFSAPPLVESAQDFKRRQTGDAE